MFIAVFFRYMDKTGLSGSRVQLINGIFLIASFTALRIVYGGFIVRTLFRPVQQGENAARGLTLIKVLRIRQDCFPSSRCCTPHSLIVLRVRQPSLAIAQLDLVRSLLGHFRSYLYL
jgi:hypothetical protein